MADNSKQNMASGKPDVQHVFIIGSKSIGQYGGYETFVDRLIGEHEHEDSIKYHVACKANGDGHMDESKLDGVRVLKKNDDGSVAEFEYKNAHVFKIPCPNIGPAVAIYYDRAAVKYSIQYCKNNHIDHPLFYILTCRIGLFIDSLVKQIKAIGGMYYLNPDGAFKPKPMIEIGGMPILWHIMKTYSYYGFNEFVICAGYKQHVIKEWFADYFLHTSDITFDYTNGNSEMIVHNKHVEPWKVTIVDTGLNTQTGGRVKRIKDYIGNETFMLTYGDAVGDINIPELIEFHKSHGKIGTMSMYNFGQNKGVVEVGQNGVIDAFREKSDTDGDLINIGFMVFEPALFDYIEGDTTIFEKGPLTSLVAERELVGYIHKGYWQCMDTLREKQQLEKLWDGGKAPWKLWEE